MTELGVFAVDRGVFDHPLLARDVSKEPFSRAEAWLWLLAGAAWKDRRYSRAGHVLTLRRGQLSHSLRYIASAWGWSKSATERFLGRLKTETMIETDTGTGALVITICNYDAYQRVSLPTGTQTGTDGGTAAGQQRDRKEDIQDIQEEERVSETGKPVLDASPPKVSRKKHQYPADFEADWRAYPTTANMSKFEAFTAWKRLDATDRAALSKAIPAFREWCRKDPSYPVLHMTRFISKRRFEGDYGAPAPADVVAEDQWVKRLQWGRAKGRWVSSQWGAPPGKPGSLVPPELLRPGDGEGWIERETAA
jgi:hypothetical protein